MPLSIPRHVPVKLATLAAAALLALTACGGSSSTRSTAGSSGSSPSADATASVDTVSATVTTTDTSTDLPSTDLATTEETTPGSAGSAAAKAIQPCTLVTRALLKKTLGTDAPAGTFEPHTVIGTGCRFTNVTAKSAVNILVETTANPTAYLSEQAYGTPPGSSPIPGADRGYVTKTVPGEDNAFILLTKGGTGVFLTLSQDHPALTTQSMHKLAAAVLAQL